jgi:hypothetical protein
MQHQGGPFVADEESVVPTIQQLTSQDPSALTIATMIREVEHLKDLHEGRIHAVEEMLKTRVDAIDKATTLFETNLTRVPTEVDRQITHLRELLESKLGSHGATLAYLQHEVERFPVQIEDKAHALQPLFVERFRGVETEMREKFHSISSQFSLRDDHVKQAAMDVKDQITTALSAAKEMVGAQNTNVDKRIDQTERLLMSSTAALDSKIAIITEQFRNMMTRQEVEQLFRTVMDKIDGPTGIARQLEGVIARRNGVEDQSRSNTQGHQWIIGVAIAIGLAVAGFLYKH